MLEKVLEVRNLTKQYGDFTAVSDLSFEVYRGEVFGLLGPNGAGKTTTIRMLMDIFKPDQLEHGASQPYIRVLGLPPSKSREFIGYLPEERGLYRDLKVVDVLVYLAGLKGVDENVARQRASSWLERVDLAEWGNRKVMDLSKGMQQKVQFVASLIHDPQLLILDEPFQGLDPVNVELIKDLIRSLQLDGKSIVLSAHQMNLVEALCDRILLINRGKVVLYGPIDEIKRRYALNTVRLRTSAEVSALPGVLKAQRHDSTYTLTLKDATPQDFLEALIANHIPIESFEIATAPLEEIFIAAVKETGDE
jgi:ABC-2 type transport system ATP-binding protein